MKNILKPTKIKISCNIFLSLAMVLAAIFLPASIISGAFIHLSLGQRILSFFVSWMASFIFYYPLTASLAHLAGSIKNSTYVLREIIWAVIFIVIFNPLTLSIFFVKLFSVNVASKANQSTQVSENEVQNGNQSTCGLKINDFTAGSKVEEAGIRKGDNILRLNGATINSVQDIFAQLADKKPGDKVILETDRGSKTVELVLNISDPSRPALGVKLVPNPCK